MKRQALVVGSLVALVAAFVIGMVVVKSQRAQEVSFLAQESAELFVRPYAPTRGPAEADVHIVEFFDPACETCARLYPHVEELLEAHPDRIRLVMRYAPFHKGADVVVRALEATRKQDLYWQALEVLYASQARWTAHHEVQIERIWPYLGSAGVDLTQLQQDMNDPAITEAIRQDLEDGATLGVRKTPSFFVNGKPLPRFGLDELQVLVQTELDGG